MVLRFVLALFLSAVATAYSLAAGWTSVSSNQAARLVAGSGSQLFAANPSSFYVSNDGGATWQSGTGPADAPYTALAYFNGGVWVGTEKRGVAYGGANGASWTVLNNGMAPLPFSADANSISSIVSYAGTNNIVAGQSVGVYLSKDGGQNWSRSVTGLPTCGTVLGSSNACAVNDVASVGSALVAATESGIARSVDGGGTWATSGLAGSKVVRLSAGSDAVYAVASGLYKSSDSGASWAAVSGLAVTPTAIYAHPSKAGTVYAGTSGGNVYQSTDGGATWSQISDGTTSSQINALAVANDTAGSLLAATSGGIYRFSGEAFDIAIPAVSDAQLNQYITSEDVTITGLTQVEAISIVGGEYSLNEGAFTSAAGKVANGAELRIRVKSASTYNTSVTATVTIGKRKGQFVVTTSKLTKVTNLDDVFETVPTGVEIDTDGKVVVTSTTTVRLKDNLPDGVLIQTTAGGGVSTDRGSLTFTDTVGGSQLSYTTVGAVTRPRVAQGAYDIDSTASGNKVAVGGGTTGGSVITTTTSQDSLTVKKDDAQSSAFVQSGKVSLQYSGFAGANGFAATTEVYAGETAEVSNTGALKQIRVGSLNGDKNIPGDPVTLANVTTDSSVPKLEGNLARLNNTASLLTVIQEALNSQFGVTSSQISYDKANGVVTYTANGKIYRFIPIGAPKVQVGGTFASMRGNRFSASNVANTASGAFTLAGRGIEVTVGSALGYFTDLDQALKAADPKSTIRLRSNGALQLGLFGANYIATPGSLSTAGQAGTPGFLVDSGTGYFAFKDSTGAVQLLYPAFADISTVDLTVKAIDPAGSTTSNGNGTATMVLGNSYVLKPEYLLIALPPAHAADLWWLDGALIYIRYPDSTAQAFTLN